MQFNYDHLRALSAVLQSGSFEGASAQLNVTQSAISQRIKALEDRVGARLVVRGTPCSATELGQRLMRHMEDVALLEAQVLPDPQERAQVSIAVNADSLATWVVPALASQKDLRFNVLVDDQDHSVELLTRGEVTAALTTRAQPVQGCDSIALGKMEYVATASPAFVAQWFAYGVTHEALREAPTLIFDRKDALQSQWAAGQVAEPLQFSGHYLPSTTAFVEAARLGLGWGMNPEPLVRDGLADGSLVELGKGPRVTTPLYWQIARHMRAPLEALTQAIRQAARAHLMA